MKKTYITPEALTISLAMTLPLAMSGHDEIGDEILTKENADNLGPTTSGGKTIWDEEW